MDSFVKKIRVLVEECSFKNPDEHIIDSLIFGSNSKRTQAKLLDKDTTLSLDTALNIARTEEATSSQIKEITADTLTRVDALKHGVLPDKPRGPTTRLCGCCGTEHDISERCFCPANVSKCGACGKENHWRKGCHSPKPHHQAHQRGGRRKHPKPPKGKPDGKKHFHSLEARDQTEGNPKASVSDQLYYHTLSVNQVTKSDTQAFLEVEVVSGHWKKPLSPTSHSSQIHRVTLVAFPLAWRHLAPSSLLLEDMLLVIMALVYLSWRNLKTHLFGQGF